MIDFRCKTADVHNPFEVDAIELIYTLSKGIPREVIKLCAVSVNHATRNKMETIPADLVEFASDDLVKPVEEVLTVRQAKSKAAKRAVKKVSTRK
jgi:Cdc6-like AAA superfamily ATPase